MGGSKNTDLIKYKFFKFKSYALQYYDLREDTITKDVLEDYVAVPRRVVSLSPKEISQKVVDKGSEYRA